MHTASPHERGEGDLVTGSVPMQRTARLVGEEPTLAGRPLAVSCKGMERCFLFQFLQFLERIASLNEKVFKKNHRHTHT